MLRSVLFTAVVIASSFSAAAEPKQLALEDFKPTSSGEAKKLVGIRVYGPVTVQSVKPDPNAVGRFLVHTFDSTGKPLPNMKWINSRWVAVRCVYACDEETALKLKPKDELNLAGDVDEVVVTEGQDFFNRSNRPMGRVGGREPQKKIKPMPADDLLIELFLLDVKTR